MFRISNRRLIDTMSTWGNARRLLILMLLAVVTAAGAAPAFAQAVDFFPPSGFCAPNGVDYSRAFGVSPGGDVVVGEYQMTWIVDFGTSGPDTTELNCRVPPPPSCTYPCPNPDVCCCGVISYLYRYNGFRWIGNNAIRLEPVTLDDTPNCPPPNGPYDDEWNYSSRANATSESGAITVGVSTNLYAKRLATVWEQPGYAPTPLGCLGTSAVCYASPFESEANDISADGSIIVGMSLEIADKGCVGCPPPIPQTAVKWTIPPGTLAWSIQALPGPTPSKAMGISADGTVIVGSAQSYAAVWTSSGWTQLPHVAHFGTPMESVALAVSNSQVGPFSVPIVAVGYTRTTNPNRNVAVKWVQNANGGWSASAIDFSNLTFICFAERPVFNSVANDVSSNGQAIVGWVSAIGCFPKRAFMWDSTNGTRLMRSFVSGFEAYTEESANGIAANSSTVAGHSDVWPKAWRVEFSQGLLDSGDVDGDGTADVADLRLVLHAWGVCGRFNGG